jgi:Ca-activated chloride channel family protein
MKQPGKFMFGNENSLGLLLCFLMLCSGIRAQEEKKYLRDGNKAYEAGKYKEAEDQYQKSVEVKPDNLKGAFNLGDAYYKQGKYKEAAAKFEELTKTITGNDKLSAEAYHNLGNALLKDKKYDECINAYKKSLSLNSTDDDTRYNLSYAQQMLKQQQQKQNKDNKDNKDKQKDKKKDPDKDKDKKDNGNKPKDKQDQDKSNKDQQNQVSKDAAKKMLKEVNNNDKKVQAKLKKQKEAGVPVKIEKDW